MPIVPGVRASRRFLGRAVRYMTSAGIRQFLDVGTGIPTASNTHDVAQSVAPECRVVHVDNDPIVFSHARALLAGTTGSTAYVDADTCPPPCGAGWPECLYAGPARHARRTAKRAAGLAAFAGPGRCRRCSEGYRRVDDVQQRLQVPLGLADQVHGTGQVGAGGAGVQLDQELAGSLDIQPG